MTEENLKLCSRCKIEKPLKDFYKDKNTKTGYKSYCKDCAKVVYKNWKDKNPDKAQEIWLTASNKYYKHSNASFKRKLKKYDLTEESYNELHLEHNGKCKICKKEIEDLVIDHCHQTGKVRGLLCNPCNKGLGFFEDNIESLRSAIEYLVAD